jgi:GNAT superfamily N-acetyltransferase
MTTTELTNRPLAVLPVVQAKEDQRAHALELERMLEDELATDSRQFRCGTALTRNELPRAGNLNVLRIESGVEPLDPAALMEFTDELQSDLPQRSIRVVDDERAAQLRPALAAAGWVTAPITVMAQRTRPDRPVDTSAVHEVDLGHIAYARTATLRRAHRDLDSAEQLLLAGALPAEDFDLRCFAATVSNEVAAYAVARVCGEVAKLTEIDSLVRAHGHGLGRAVIWGTVKALREEGVRLVVVEADDDTWAKWIYLRLGFEDIGHLHRFVRPWGDERTPPPAI